MVEEVKLTFKGQVGNNSKTFRLFVGIVDEIVIYNEYKVLRIKGKDLISNKEETIQITDKKEITFSGLHSIKNIIHIEKGDILVFHERSIRSLFRINNSNNSIFATVRCNSNCLMCSQPPLDFDDINESILTWLYAIELMPLNIKFIGITGGEPTLLGTGLVDIVNKLLNKYPDILIDILSNGRLQARKDTMDVLSKIISPDRVIFAIPLYSDVYKEHDYIVQAKDAFYQTCLGIHNMASFGFLIEIRVVLHKLSIKRLLNLSKFIHFNFPFSYHITFMGLEIIGYTKANKDLLLIQNQKEYIESLNNSLTFLDKWKYNVSVYNTPFCHLPQNLWEYAKQSISDWKNSFHEECDNCLLKNKCAGFFSWNLPYSEVKPILNYNETIIN
jgi:His-Xaa-Ser system radical SAM maturase HxsC